MSNNDDVSETQSSLQMCLCVCVCRLLSKCVVHLACTTSHTEKFITHTYRHTHYIPYYTVRYVLAQKAHTTVLDLWPEKQRQNPMYYVNGVSTLVGILPVYTLISSFSFLCRTAENGKRYALLLPQFPEKKPSFKLDNYFVIN